MNGNDTHESPAQLANLLSQSYAQAEQLRRELDSTRRRADKAERALAAFQQANAASKSQGPAGTNFTENQIRLVLLDYEARAEAAEVRGDELDARLLRIQAEWSMYEDTINNLLAQAADSRNWLGRVMELKGGETHIIGGVGPAQAELNGMRQRMGVPSRPAHNTVYNNNAHNGPPANPRVRPRAGSMDGAAYPQHLSGPGGPPPAKKVRTDHESSRRSRARPRSQSPSNAPPTQYPNGQDSPQLAPGAPHHVPVVAQASLNPVVATAPGRDRAAAQAQQV
ncbi:hypothetical protein EUX98_g9580 [Antrodiella citrinella]|uniref:Uncharacterized protein n=1 Tax=Antrodiella citrinella TaxID=2447956 RepID=A0A4S4LSS8_9APHY|nr:hypothetical protein EUX98_g9580 [Antrodiella citrinella]